MLPASAKRLFFSEFEKGVIILLHHFEVFLDDSVDLSQLFDLQSMKFILIIPLPK
jgi:hypothetical protein